AIQSFMVDTIQYFIHAGILSLEKNAESDNYQDWHDNCMYKNLIIYVTNTHASSFRLNQLTQYFDIVLGHIESNGFSAIKTKSLVKNLLEGHNCERNHIYMCFYTCFILIAENHLFK